MTTDFADELIVGRRGMVVHEDSFEQALLERTWKPERAREQPRSRGAARRSTQQTPHYQKRYHQGISASSGILRMVHG